MDDISTSSDSLLNSNGSKKDPRDGCCWEGQHFFDAFKAIFTRLLFSLHAILAIWQVTRLVGRRYWWLSVSYAGLLIETFVVLLKRRGQEWRWWVQNSCSYLISRISCLLLFF